MHIISTYAALLGLLFFYLSLRTVKLRRKLKIGIGYKENDEMLRTKRVHSNFSEYVPITLLMIYFVEIQEAHYLVVHTLGSMLFIGRMLHAYGVSQLNEKFIFRISGIGLTFTSLIASSIILLFNSIIS